MKNKPSDNKLLLRTENGKLVSFVEGGRKAAETNKRKYGINFYMGIGKLGGQKSRGGGFAAATPEQVREWGRKGGAKSRKRGNDGTTKIN